MVEFRPKRNVLQPALDFAFGYDFFISYSHGDGNNYPKHLQQRLQELGFKVFLDLSEYAAGTDLPRETLRQVRKSRKLIVIARRASLVSEWVARETNVALSQGKIPILININSAIEAAASTSPLAKIAIDKQWLILNEALDNPDGNPSDDAIANIARGFKNTRQETKRIRLLAAATAILATTTIAAVWQGYVATSNERRAVKSEQLAKDNEQRAVSARDVATSNESKALAALSQGASLSRKYGDAVMFALAAWPRAGDQERPFLQQTIDALSAALPWLRERARRVASKRFESAKFIRGTELFVIRPARGPVEIWDVKTWTKRRELGGEKDAFWSISSTGTLIGAGMRDGSVRIYELASGALLNSVNAHSDAIKSLVFSPDGQSLATASYDKTVRILSTSTLETIAHVMRDASREPEFSPDGKSLLIANLFDGVFAINARTGHVIAKMEPSRFPDSATFIGSGDRIGVTAELGVMVFEASSGRRLSTLGDCPNSTGSVFPSTDRSRLLFTCKSKGIIYDAKSLSPLATIEGPSVAAQVSFSADNAFLATVAWNGHGELWDGVTGKKIGDLAGHTDGILSVDISPQGDVITASPDGTVRLWNAAFTRSRVLGRFGDQSNKDIAITGSPALSSDGGQVLFVANGFIQILSLDSLKRHDLAADGTIVFARFCQGRDSILAIEYSGDLLVLSSPASRTLTRVKGKATAGSCSQKGDVIAVGDQRGEVRLLNTQTGEVIRVLGRVSGDRKIADIALSPDGAFVAAAAGGTVNIWRTDTTGELVSSIDGGSSVEIIQYSPDGSVIAIAGEIGAPTKLYEANTGRLKTSLRDANQRRRAVQFSTNGQRLITPRGNIAMVWDGATGAAMASYPPHEVEVIWSAFVRDGKAVLTTSIDGETRIWDFVPPETGDAFNVACQRLLNTQALDQLAGAFGLENLKPICAVGHEPIAFKRVP